VSSRIFDGFTRGFALSVLSVGFPNYETILCSHIYTVYDTERMKTVSEERRTVEFCSKFAWISFIAFGEFLIHVNKFRDYKNSYLRSSLNTQQTCGGNLENIYFSAMYSSISCFVDIYFCVMCIMSCLKTFRTVQCVSISCFKDISAVQCVVYFSISSFEDTLLLCHL